MKTLGLFILFVVQIAYASDFYIAVNGGDTDDCGSIETPCATLNFTLTLASDGDTIYLQEGEYFNQPNVTISQNSLSLIGQGNVTFNGIGIYENLTLIYVTGNDLSVENIQFVNFYVHSYIYTISLIEILISDNGKYNFTNISFVNGRHVVITTIGTNETLLAIGEIFLNNVTIKDSVLAWGIFTNLQVTANQLVIDNSTSGNSFVYTSVRQQAVPVVNSFTDSAVINNSDGDFLVYYGPFYFDNSNFGGDDLTTFTNFTFSDSTGTLVACYGANLIVTSSYADNVNLDTTNGFISHAYPVSLQVTNSVFNGFYHPVNGHIVYINNSYNKTGSTILIDSVTLSNSLKTDLNYGYFHEELVQSTYTNLNFINVTDPTIFNVLTSLTTVENLYFSGCTGGPFYSGVTLGSLNATAPSISNITIVDTNCYQQCISFWSGTQPAITSVVNNVTLVNINSTSSDNFLFYVYFNIFTNSTPSFTVNNFKVENATGFSAVFDFTHVHFTLEGEFEYNNVTTPTNANTPVFDCGILDVDTVINVNTLLGLPLVDLVQPLEICTINYFGFTFVTNNSTYLGGYDPDHEYPISIIVACGCVSLLVAVVAVCFIIYRNTGKAYSAIN